MAWIAFDLDRPALNRSHDDAAPVSGERQARSQNATARPASRAPAFAHKARSVVRPAAGGERQRRAADEQFECRATVEAASRD